MAAGTDRLALEGIMKTVQAPKIVKALNDLNPLKDIVETIDVDESWGGFEVTFPAVVDRNIAGTMFGGEDTAIPDASNMVAVKVRINQAKQYGRVRMTWESIQDTSGKGFAWKRARQFEMDGLIDSLARREEAALTLDGRGVLARVDEANPDGDTTLELDAPGGITGDNFGNRFTAKNMFLMFVNPATGALRTQSAAAAKVTAVNSDGTDVTVGTASDIGTDVANSDFVVQAANSSVTAITDTSWENAWWGLVGLFDDGTFRTNYFGIDRNLYDAYNTYVVGSTGALSMDLLQRSVDVVDQKLGGKVNILFMHHDIRRLVLQLQDADRRYTSDRLLSPDIGTKAMTQGEITVGTIPIKVIRDFPLDMIMGIDTKKAGITQYVSEPGKWADEFSGSILKQVGTGSTLKDSAEAYWRRRKQVYADMPGVAFRLDAITGQTHVTVRAP